MTNLEQMINDLANNMNTNVIDLKSLLELRISNQSVYKLNKND